MKTISISLLLAVSLAAQQPLPTSLASIEKSVHRYQLESGFPLKLLPKETAGDRVLVALDLRYGDAQSVARQESVGQIVARLLLRGTRNRTSQQIQDSMRQLNATISFPVGKQGVGARFSTTAQNLSPALELAVEMLREPNFSESDFGVVRQELIALAEGARETVLPGNQALLAMLNPYPRSDSRHVSTVDERIEDLNKATLDDVRTYHQKFYGASQGQLIVVGKFDEVALRRDAARLLGSWKSLTPWVRPVRAYSNVVPANTKIETPGETTASFQAGVMFPIKDTDPDYLPMVLATTMFRSDLIGRLRREGLNYLPSAFFSTYPLYFELKSEAALFSISATGSPRSMPRLESCFMDELRKKVGEGFAEAELVAAKNAIQFATRLDGSTDQSILDLLQYEIFDDHTLDWRAGLAERRSAVTLDQVNGAFRRYINPDAISILEAGDFANAGVAAQTPPAAAQVLGEAKAKAAAAQKNVFLIFQASWCGWCKQLDKFIETPENKAIIERHFVVAHLTVQEQADKAALNHPGGEEILAQFGGKNSGLPYFAFLDARGALIVNSTLPPDGKRGGSNIGHPVQPEEIDWFMAMLRKAVPALKGDEARVLKDWLTEHSKT